MSIHFPTPELMVPEVIAEHLAAAGMGEYPDPPAVTAEELADDLASLGLFSLGGDHSGVTAEDVANALNGYTAINATITLSLRAWRSW